MRLPDYSKYGLYDCWNCLCEVCTRRYCRTVKRHAKYDFCVRMMELDFCPVRKCDFFEHKEIHLVLRVSRKGKHKKSEMIMDRLNEILAKLDRM